LRSAIGLANGSGAGATLIYTGTGETVTRAIDMQSVTASVTITNNGGSGALTLGNITSSGTGSHTLILNGTNNNANTISGTIVDTGGINKTSLAKSGSGKWVLSGQNTYTGSTTVNSGVLALDYSSSGSNNNPILSSTSTLSLLGGTLQLNGGSYTQTVASTIVNTGTSFVQQTGGSSKLGMGAITFTAGAVDFSADSIATTSNSVTNGILSQRATVAGANFAMKSGSNIVAYDYATSGSTGYAGGTMSNNNNYAMVGTGTTTLGASTGAASNTLKITTSATGSLDVNTKTLTTGAILFAGSNDYAITTSGAGKIVNTLLLNYGTTGNLSLGALGAALVQYGTGKTILTANATTDNALSVYGGTVQFSSNLQIGTNASVKVITLNNGKIIADTTGGSIALDNAGANSRTFTIGAGGGTIDIIGGNTLTVSGVMSGTGDVTVGSGASTNGTVNLTAANTYTGATTVSAGTLLLSSTGSIASTSGVSVSKGATFTNNSGTAFSKALTLTEGAILGGSSSFAPTSMTLIADLTGGVGSFTTFAVGSFAKAGNLALTLSGMTNGNYTLLSGSSLTGAFSTMEIGGTFLTNDGSGNFSGTVNGTAYTFTNSSELLGVTVPEPATWALLAFSLTTVMVLRRRRNS